MAVAMPALNAYLVSRSANLFPTSHRVCLTRPTNGSLFLGGVWIVLGAWGRTLGNDATGRRWSGIIYAAIMQSLGETYAARVEIHT